jgi:DNA-binding LytR/AlgR family response regulator
VCIGKEAYGFYGTIDKLVDNLPSNFIRCHRGFIVNKYKIEKVILSQNIIYLEDGFDVPLSRSYKSLFKGMKKYEQ